MTHFLFAMGFKYSLIIMNINLNNLISQFVLLIIYLIVVILFSNMTYFLIEKKFYKK